MSYATNKELILREKIEALLEGYGLGSQEGEGWIL